MTPRPQEARSAAKDRELLDEVLDEVGQLRDDLAAWVLRGEGPMWTLPMVLDELCRILAEEPPHAD